MDAAAKFVVKPVENIAAAGEDWAGRHREGVVGTYKKLTTAKSGISVR